MPALWSATDIARQIQEMVSAHVEKQLERSLNELLKRGLLTTRKTELVLVQDPDGQLAVRQSIDLLLKDQEYVEKLEAENADLKKQVEEMRAVFSRMKGWVE